MQPTGGWPVRVLRVSGLPRPLTDCKEEWLNRDNLLAVPLEAHTATLRDAMTVKRMIVKLVVSVSSGVFKYMQCTNLWIVFKRPLSMKSLCKRAKPEFLASTLGTLVAIQGRGLYVQFINCAVKVELGWTFSRWIVAIHHSEWDFGDLDRLSGSGRRHKRSTLLVQKELVKARGFGMLVQFTRQSGNS